jgi:hypothetical protein
MSGSYMSIGQKIVLDVTIADLSRSDQVRLMCDLMRATGISDALFLNSANSDANRKVYQTVADAYLAG